MKYLVRGGAGFIGSSYIKYLINKTNSNVLNLDKLSYASNINSLDEVSTNKRYRFIKADICNFDLVKEIILDFKPDYLVHFAAESHVDRSIKAPRVFIETNILGTFNLLEASKIYWNELIEKKKNTFRFHHISTDEVYGSLGKFGSFIETTAYDPSSPYSASKASSDHLVMSWHRTFELPVLITNCSNNYGPFQSYDKLIPVVIRNAIEGTEIPIFGSGKQVRDWLYVEDHVDALHTIINTAEIGETFNIGGNNEKTNIQVVNLICEIIDDIKPRENGKSYKELIKFVTDRPGHDFRYAINPSKIRNKINWEPKFSFEEGLTKTIKWYLKDL